MSLLQTIETDLVTAGRWLEDEVVGFAENVWGLVKTVFNTAEPVIVNDVVNAINAFIPTVTALIQAGTPLAELEQAFVQWSETEAKSILTSVEALGSVLVQALLALAIQTAKLSPKA